MKRLMHALIAVVSAGAFACGGNSDNSQDRNMAGLRGAPPDRNTTAMNQRGTDASGRATLTGCLLAGGDAGTYVLQLASAEMSGSGGSNSTPSAAAHMPVRTYRIVSDRKQDLQQNVNK